MAIYLYNILSIPIYGALIKNKKWLVFLISTQIFLILALRAETLGVDLNMYSLQFYSYQSYSALDMLRSFRFVQRSAISWGQESGFTLLSWLVGALGFEFHAFMVVVAAIAMTGIGKFIYRYAEDVTLSYMCIVALGLFSLLFGILRQSCGLAFFLGALPALKERDAKKYFACTIVATLFHVIFLMMIPLWFLARIKMSRNWGLAVAGASVAGALVFPVLLRTIVIPVLVRLRRDYYEKELLTFQWNNMFVFIMAIFLMVILLDRTGSESLRNKQNELYWSFAMALPLQTAAFFMTGLSRASIGIFLPVGCVLLGNVLRRYPEHKTAFFIRVMMGLFLIVFYILTIRIDPYIVPYVSVFA